MFWEIILYREKRDSSVLTFLDLWKMPLSGDSCFYDSKCIPASATPLSFFCILLPLDPEHGRSPWHSAFHFKSLSLGATLDAPWIFCSGCDIFTEVYISIILCPQLNIFLLVSYAYIILFFLFKILSFLHLLTCVYVIWTPPAPKHLWAEPVPPSGSLTLLTRKHKR
jgi:hypothetical protein